MGLEMEVSFQDYFPVMARKLGHKDFVDELCKGFDLLADPATGTITLESLKRNVKLLGLEELREEDLQAMLREGDYDGDGALNQDEFCILMLRISPAMLEEAEEWLEEAIGEELADEMDEDECDSAEPWLS